MAEQYDNTNRGALFKNNKDGNEKRPDYRGNLNVAGTEYWISAWLKESREGRKYMSLTVEPKQPKEEKPAAEKPVDDPFKDDDIPF